MFRQDKKRHNDCWYGFASLHLQSIHNSFSLSFSSGSNFTVLFSLESFFTSKFIQESKWKWRCRLSLYWRCALFSWIFEVSDLSVANVEVENHFSIENRRMWTSRRTVERGSGLQRFKNKLRMLRQSPAGPQRCISRVRRGALDRGSAQMWLVFSRIRSIMFYVYYVLILFL